jgi:hypothetical protein
MPEPIFMKLGTYIMAPKPISTSYFKNTYDQCGHLYVYPLAFDKQRFGKNVTVAMNTHTTEACFTHLFLCCPCRIEEK